MSRTIYVRWLGAFRQGGRHHSLAEVISFEMERQDEAACEMISKAGSSHVHAHIGLKVAEKAVFRRFNRDCWSFYDGGKLKTNSPKRQSDHNEAWYRCGNAVEAIIVDRPWQQLSGKTRDALRAVQKKYQELPIYQLKGGRLSKIELPKGHF